MKSRNAALFVTALFVLASLIAWLLFGDVFAGILLAVLACVFKPAEAGQVIMVKGKEESKDG